MKKKYLLFSLLTIAVATIISCSKKNESNVTCDQFGNCTNTGTVGTVTCSNIGQQCIASSGQFGICQSGGFCSVVNTGNGGACNLGNTLGCGNGGGVYPPASRYNPCVYDQWYGCWNAQPHQYPGDCVQRNYGCQFRPGYGNSYWGKSQSEKSTN